MKEAYKEENVDKEEEKNKKEGKEEMSTEEKKVDADKKDGEKCPADEAGWSVRGAVGKAAGNFIVNQAVRQVGQVAMSTLYTYSHVLLLHFRQDLMDKYVWGDDKNDDGNEGVGAMMKTE